MVWSAEFKSADSNEQRSLNVLLPVGAAREAFWCWSSLLPKAWIPLVPARCLYTNCIPLIWHAWYDICICADACLFCLFGSWRMRMTGARDQGYLYLCWTWTVACLGSAQLCKYCEVCALAMQLQSHAVVLQTWLRLSDGSVSVSSWASMWEPI